MSEKQPSVVDCTGWSNLMSELPVLTSFQSGWSSIQLTHHREFSIDLPETLPAQHMLIIALSYPRFDLDFFAEGCLQTIPYRENDCGSGWIQIVPADLPHSVRFHSSGQAVEWITCFLEPTFLAQIARETVNPDRVEILLMPKKVDLLLHQMGLALKSSLEVDGIGSRFYADSMATALSAHLLHHYSTRDHCFREYEDGLSKQKLKQAIEYVQAHLGEDISLTDIANELGMSQYYFCHLFKRSTGVSPHQYLIQQRVEQAKRLLKQTERTITAIAMDCGFANQSHFAKCFRQSTGMNPNQFRKL